MVGFGPKCSLFCDSIRWDRTQVQRTFRRAHKKSSAGAGNMSKSNNNKQSVSNPARLRSAECMRSLVAVPHLFFQCRRERRHCWPLAVLRLQRLLRERDKGTVWLCGCVLCSSQLKLQLKPNSNPKPNSRAQLRPNLSLSLSRRRAN